MRIVGVMPMAGTGSRLGLPFPKALAPTFDADGSLVPLYTHALRRLCRITDEVCAVVSLAGFGDPCLRLPGVRQIVKGYRGEAPSSIALAAQEYPGTWLAMAFPDTVWEPENGMATLAASLDESVEGVLGLFCQTGDMLDAVTAVGGMVTGIDQKRPDLRDELVWGWGCFIVKSDVAAAWTDEGYISDNLARMRLRAVALRGPYNDCGTPEQYRRVLSE